MTSQSIHYNRHLIERPASKTGACGTISSSQTATAAEVTCRRCLKTLETGSALTGKLAGR